MALVSLTEKMDHEAKTHNPLALYAKYYERPHEKLAETLGLTKKKKDWNGFYDFLSIVKADPTSITPAGNDENGETLPIVKYGDYMKWIMRQMLNVKTLEEYERFVEEDLPKYTNALSDFASLKLHKRIPLGQRDINSYPDLVALLDYLRRFKKETDDAFTEKIASETKFEYEDDECQIVIPLTEHASQYWGKGSNWCTAIAGYAKAFESYTKQGPLYIIISKKDPSVKYQMHFETSQFMDKNDRSLVFEDLIKNCGKGLMHYFSRIRKILVPETVQEDGINIRTTGLPANQHYWCMDLRKLEGTVALAQMDIIHVAIGDGEGMALIAGKEHVAVVGIELAKSPDVLEWLQRKGYVGAVFTPEVISKDGIYTCVLPKFEIPTPVSFPWGDLEIISVGNATEYISLEKNAQFTPK